MSEITANTVTNGSVYEAIVLPNGNVTGMKFTFTTTGGTYEVAVPTPTTNNRWESGKKYTYTVTLKRNEVLVNGSAGDWTAGSSHGIDGLPQ
jgi:hypothetical protein